MRHRFINTNRRVIADRSFVLNTLCVSVTCASSTRYSWCISPRTTEDQAEPTYAILRFYEGGRIEVEEAGKFSEVLAYLQRKQQDLIGSTPEASPALERAVQAESHPASSNPLNIDPSAARYVSTSISAPGSFVVQATNNVFRVSQDGL